MLKNHNKLIKKVLIVQNFKLTLKNVLVDKKRLQIWDLKLFLIQKMIEHHL